MCRSRCRDDEKTAVYIDRGFSGKNLKRPGYLRMIHDLNAGKIRRVIVYRLDRLSRSVSDFSAMWQIFEQHGVEFSSISEQFDTSTPIGKAMVYIIMTFAQLERETIAERITDNYYARVRSGAWPGGRAPFGFRCAESAPGDTTYLPWSPMKMPPPPQRYFSITPTPEKVWRPSPGSSHLPVGRQQSGQPAGTASRSPAYSAPPST